MSSKQRNDIDVMIEILEEAALRSIDAEPPGDKQRSPQELRLIMDLIDETMVRGENLDDYKDPLMPRDAALLVLEESAATSVEAVGRKPSRSYADGRSGLKGASRIQQAQHVGVGV